MITKFEAFASSDMAPNAKPTVVPTNHLKMDTILKHFYDEIISYYIDEIMAIYLDREDIAVSYDSDNGTADSEGDIFGYRDVNKHEISEIKSLLLDELTKLSDEAYESLGKLEPINMGINLAAAYLGDKRIFTKTWTDYSPATKQLIAELGHKLPDISLKVNSGTEGTIRIFEI